MIAFHIYNVTRNGSADSSRYGILHKMNISGYFHITRSETHRI